MLTDNYISSVDKIIEYVNIDEIENPKDKPPGWPNEGLISIRNLNVKCSYSNVRRLRNFNLTVRPKEKIAVINVDNTDAHILFKIFSGLIDDDKIYGNIQIDGENLFDVDMNYRRKKIFYLYDKAVAFEGTLHDNIDPDGEYTVNEIMKVFQY